MLDLISLPSPNYSPACVADFASESEENAADDLPQNVALVGRRDFVVAPAKQKGEEGDEHQKARDGKSQRKTMVGTKALDSTEPRGDAHGEQGAGIDGEVEELNGGLIIWDYCQLYGKQPLIRTNTDQPWEKVTKLI